MGGSFAFPKRNTQTSSYGCEHADNPMVVCLISITRFLLAALTQRPIRKPSPSTTPRPSPSAGNPVIAYAVWAPLFEIRVMHCNDPTARAMTRASRYTTRWRQRPH